MFILGNYGIHTVNREDIVNDVNPETSYGFESDHWDVITHGRRLGHQGDYVEECNTDTRTEMTSKDSGDGIGQTSINRRTALQMAGAGLAGSALFSGSAAAGGRWDALVLLVNSDLAGPGDEFGNITTDGKNNELVLDGGVLFNKNEGADAIGGGPFSLEGPGVTDIEGEWEAKEVVRFERYGAFPASESMLPQSVKGGLVELEVDFEPSIDGVEDDYTLIIECAVGTQDSDEPEFGSGFFIGNYTEVKAAFNLFNYP